jgi:glycine cleavage system H protein
MVPDDLLYTAEHEWVRRAADGRLRVGITHFAQEQLGTSCTSRCPRWGRR